jgi:HK97 family phage portal protein
MGLFDRMARGAAQRSSAGVPSYGMIPPLGSVQSASGLLVSQATAMAVGAVYACVSLIAHDVARCAPTLYDVPQGQAFPNRSLRAGVTTKGHDDRGLTINTDHELALLLDRPNRVQTWFEFARDLMVAYLLRGNAYAAKLTNGRGQVTELILINPDAVMVLEASNGDVFYNVNRLGLFQIAMLQQFPVAIPSESVFHLRGIAFNMLVAASTIGLARDAIGLSMGQSQQQSRWIGNGARPSGILESPRTLSDPAAKRLKASWQEFNAGIQNEGRTAVLENGIKFTPMKLTAADIDFINSCNLGIQDICRFFGVPPRKVGQPDLTRGSTIIQEDQAYVNGAISPKLDMIEQKFDREFNLKRDGHVLDMNEDALLRADPLTRYNLGRIGKLSGLITTNEWRRSERLPPDPNGDEIMQPVNMAALGSDMTGTAPDNAGRPPANQTQAETGNAQGEAPEG